MLQSSDIKSGFVKNTPVQVMSDTGCTTVFVRADLVHDKRCTGTTKKFIMINNSTDFAAVAQVYIDCQWFKGEVEALCRESLMCDVILGQINGSTVGAAVETRAMKVKATKPLKVSQGLSGLNVSSKQEDQKADKTLTNA